MNPSDVPPGKIKLVTKSGEDVLLSLPLFDINFSEDDRHVRAFFIQSLGLVRHPDDFDGLPLPTGDVFVKLHGTLATPETGFGVNSVAFDWLRDRFGLDKLAFIVETGLFEKFGNWIEGVQEFARFSDLTENCEEILKPDLIRWRSERKNFSQELPKNLCINGALGAFNDPFLWRVWILSKSSSSWFTPFSVNEKGQIYLPPLSGIFSTKSAFDSVPLPNQQIGFCASREQDAQVLERIMTTYPHLKPLLYSAAATTEDGLRWIEAKASGEMAPVISKDDMDSGFMAGPAIN